MSLEILSVPLKHVTYAPVKLEVAMPIGLGDAFTRNSSFDLDFWVKVTQNGVWYPLHNVIYAPAKLEVAKSNGLGKKIHLQEKNII